MGIASAIWEPVFAAARAIFLARLVPSPGLGPIVKPRQVSSYPLGVALWCGSTPIVAAGSRTISADVENLLGAAAPIPAFENATVIASDLQADLRRC